jgi:DNA (cytosine-5)-methyltransferase 1
MEKNFGRLVSPVICEDILDTPTREILRAAGLRAGQRPDLLIGGPPCTPFSKSGFWLEWKREGLNPGASLLQAYTRVLTGARPRRFVLENVYALTYRNKASRPAFDRLMRESDAAGYHCDAKVLNAADYGVPQGRPRLFIIGIPNDEPCPRLPDPTHGGRWEGRKAITLQEQTAHARSLLCYGERLRRDRSYWDRDRPSELARTINRNGAGRITAGMRTTIRAGL